MSIKNEGADAMINKGSRYLLIMRRSAPEFSALLMVNFPGFAYRYMQFFHASFISLYIFTSLSLVANLQFFVE